MVTTGTGSPRIEDSFPLAPIQEGMLFNSLYAPGSSVDVIIAVLELHEELDEALYLQAWQHVVDGNPALRTCFRWQGLEQPCQEVWRGVSQPWRSEDWSALSKVEQELRWQALLVRERGTGLDMARPPLTRLVLVRLGPERHRILWVYHHAVFDGLGMTLVLSQVFAAWRALQRGERPVVPPAPTQRELVQWMAQRDPGRSEHFWRERLAGIESPTRLGFDRGDDEVAIAGRHETCPSQASQLSEADTAALAAWVARHGLSLNLVLQGAWAVVLSRCSGERRVLFGVVKSGRRSSLPGADRLVGVVMNTLPVVVDVDPAAEVLAWMAQLKEQWTALREHEHTPLVRIKEWSAIDGRRPLFETSLCTDALDLTAALRAQGGDWSGCTADAFGQPVVPVSLNAYGGSRLLLRINYHELRVSQKAVARMLGHLQTVLAAFVHGEAAVVGDLPILTREERREALSLAGPSRAIAPDATVHGLVEAQCARTPQAVAVGADEGQLSYAELDARADRLAACLRARGVGPDRMVGLCVERGLHLPVAMLGILKAGGAWVPLDPAFPAERLALVLQDTAARILVTQRSLLGALPSFDGEVLCIDELPEPSPAAPAQAPATVHAGHLAYVIHTSGSTGRPKGVQLSHGAVVNFLLAMAAQPGLRPHDVLLAVTTLSFDIAVLELLLPLCVGARVEIASREVAGDGLLLRRKLAATRATVMQATPSTWQQLIQSDWRGDGRLVMLCGGEELPRSLAHELLRRGGALWNMYGPTETTVWSAAGRVVASDDGPERAAPEQPVELGPPIANTQFVVLDDGNRLLPRGVPGELFIGGAGLARGYLNQPALTAERFIDSPWPDELPGRLYRTGDRACRDEQGRLLFLGRVDRQVKLRGHRIELGEIESVLRETPAVREAVVLAREDTPGDRRLVAYVVPAEGAACELQAVRDALAARLPDYMLPTAIVPLVRLPLGPNGKLDRRALPAPQARAAAAEFIAPVGETQAAVAVMCADLLATGPLGAHDDFFALGGHSLLATRLVSRLRNRFGVELLLRQLFDEPTVAGIAACVDAARVADKRLAPTPIVPLDRTGELPLSFAQRRLWLLHQMGSGDAYHMHLVLGLRGKLDRAALQRALNDLMARHEVLRTGYTSRDGRPVAVVAEQVALPVEVTDRSGLAGREREGAVRAHVIATTEARFDLQRPPLLRARLLRLGGADHVLVLAMHHILADAWSLDLLVRELAAHYAAAVTGRPAELPLLTVQYADFAAWQAERMSGDALRRQVEHWKRQLDGAPTMLELPTDRPRPAEQTHAGAAHAFSLGRGLTAALRAAAQRAWQPASGAPREQPVTVAMLCLAGFHALLARHSGQKDLVLGMPIANRPRSEVEDLIGMFVNTLALRIDASDDPEFGVLLQRVQRACLQAYDHQELPFEKLVEELVPERDLSRTPLFQVLFSMNAARSAELSAAGLTLGVLPFELTRVRFDLELHLFEAEADIDALLAFNTDLFDASTIARLVGHLQRLLEAAVVAPETRVSALPLLLDDEREMLLAAWAGAKVGASVGAKVGAKVEAPQQACLHQLFEAQADRTPEAPALRSDAGSITYRELDERSNRLAHLLVQRGVGPESRIGICMERSHAMVVAVLAVLKAGAAYVPLDPSYPEARLALMARVAALPIILADGTTRALLADLAGRHVAAPASQIAASDLVSPGLVAPEILVPGTVVPDTVVLDTVAPDIVVPEDESARLSACPATRVARAVMPQQLAYVLFTSGSTGVPKGVAMPHAPLVNLMHWQRAHSDGGPGSRTLQFAPLAFDVSCQELFATLGSGGTLCLIDDEMRRDPQALLSFLVRHEVHRVFMPFVAMQQMIEVAIARDAVPPALREVITAGEQLQVGAALVEFFSRLPQCRLVNQYGPTECHVVTSLTLEGAPASWPRLPSIGRPIDNVRTCVLDGLMQPTPLGVVGELYLGGVGIARGYLGDAELTARRFVPDPFATDPQARLYRTGDLVRFLADGCLEFLGRADTQVKLRGFRVELGEVEAVLLDHPRVQQAALLVREDLPGDRRLVAYVVAAGADDGPTPTPCDLRAFLKERLPAYMLPAAFVLLASLPLTPSGKLDRNALPAPEGRPSGPDFVAPRTATETRVAGIWSGLLGVERVGVHDDFFELGGHSLLAMQVIARLRDAFGVALPLRVLFESPNVAELAGHVDAQRLAAAGATQARLAADDDEVIEL